MCFCPETMRALVAMLPPSPVETAMAWLALARARVANGLPPRTPLAAPAAPRKSVDRPEGTLPGNWLAGANHWRYAVGNVKRGRQGSFVTF